MFGDKGDDDDDHDEDEGGDLDDDRIKGNGGGYNGNIEYTTGVDCGSDVDEKDN